MRKILNKINILQNTPQRQRGAVLLIMLVILIMGASAMLLSSLNSSTARMARDKVTADALAQAKEALIGYATTVELSGNNRPGDLPCPDLDNDGLAETASGCGSAAGSSQEKRLGRLPWKTLGISDLRDGSGERLWYAVSNNFKEHWNTALLNSDTVGTISVFSPDGALIYDGAGSTGAVAVIIAPGEVLTRQDSSLPQNRNCTIGVDCDIQEKCTTAPPTLTPKCDPKNYLDIPSVGVNPKDNDKFIDGSPTDGFIQGRIKDANDKVILNDQILVITQNSIMQAIQKRVAGEVKNCLDSYATAGNGRYPWATPINNISIPNYLDQSNTLFGRIPDDMNRSKTDSTVSAIPTMLNQWVGSCKTHTAYTPNPWWVQWQESVFYALSDKFKPANAVAPDFLSTCAIPGNCLSINNTSTSAKYVVIVAGKKLSSPDQSQRDTNKTNAFFYLEGGNENATQSGAYTFIHSSPSATFNDSMVHQ